MSTTTTGAPLVPTTPEDLVGPEGTERVTRFPVRLVDLGAFAVGPRSTAGTAAASPGQLALITMDNGLDHTKPTTLGPAGLVQMREALDRVEQLVADGSVQAVAITGKPFVFAAGADLKDVARITSSEQALGLARLGHDQLRRLGELDVPSFAFVNGVALGGGTEVALHCTYRTISSAAGRIALPEAALGLVPGWGGTHLVPHLVGIERALQVVVANPLANNRMLTGPQAVELGLGDVLLEPADFVEESLRWAAGVLTGHVPDPAAARAPVDLDAERWDAAIGAARRAVRAKLHGAAPAFDRALDLLARARTDDRDAGFAAEDAALTELLVSEEFRSSVYALDLTQRRAKRPAGAPDRSLARPVGQVGVVGAGLMASQLALLFVRRLKVPVVLTDLDADRVAAGVARVHGEIEKLAQKGRLSPDAARRLAALVSGSTSYEEAFSGADWVIEAVFEDLDVKRQVFAALEEVVSDTCVLATNTSSLSVAAMAQGLRHPERVVGFHFFNPVAVLPLVEVARTAEVDGRPGSRGTDDATLATAFAVGAKLGKSCVLVADAPAFVVNRLLMRFMGEVHTAFDEGTPAAVADTALAPLGFPMTPFTLLRLVGPAVALHVQETLHAAFPDRFEASPNIARIVAAGLPGFLAEGADPDHPELDPRVAELLVVGDSPSTAEQVRERALSALAQEARLILDEGVVADPRDIDLCLLLGVGWPPHLGGLLPLLDRSGIAERVTGQRFLPLGAASVPRSSSPGPAVPRSPGGPHLAVATSADHPEVGEDGPLLLPALARAGLAVEVAVWDDPAVDWDAFDAVLVRSTWDYVARLPAFLAWAERCPRLLNPAPVLRWNTDKRYLADLARAGVPVVPTRFLAPGEAFAVPPAWADGDVVVKPAVGAGARDTARTSPGDTATAAALVERLHGEERTVLLQPYQSRIEAEGETALVHLGGTHSHAARKGALLAGPQGRRAAPDGRHEETISAVTASAEQLAVAGRVLAALPAVPALRDAGVGGAPVYARIDLVPDDAGRPVLLELELVEPSLFLATDPAAADRFAAAVAGALETHR